MKTIEILLQGEHIPDIQLVEIGPETDVKEMLAVAARHRKSEVEGEFFVFVEGGDEPLKRDDHLPESENGGPLRIHVHRCHRIKVDVTFNGVTKEHSFGPGTTIAAVEKWAAIKAFGMTPADAAEHVLQLAGKTERPEPDTHIGSLATCPDCHLAFDLVPLKRVEGQEMADELVPPDEQMLRCHLESGRFRSGIACGWWRLVALKWPHVNIGVSARDGVEYGFRFHCGDYPRTAVTGRPWDLEVDAPLPTARWPKGRGRVALAFNPSWKNGTCLYLPCDRQSIDGHDKWRHEHPALLWEPKKGLCKYLAIIHELLNSNDYEGRRGA